MTSNASAAGSTAQIPAVGGSAEARQFNLPHFQISLAKFPALSVLGRHSHPSLTIGTVLTGGFATRVRDEIHACRPGVWWVEPAFEEHENDIGKLGASVMLIEPLPTDSLEEDFHPLFATHRLQNDGVVYEHARRLNRELLSGDRYAHIAAECAVLEMLLYLARLPQRSNSAMPACVRLAKEVILSDLRNPPYISDLARAAAVSPAFLTRAFKQSVGLTIPSFVRRTRVDEAVRAIRSTKASLSSIAYDFGFCDQSHLTRECRRFHGRTPRELRKGV
jgi:AraC-like DNA-binding protein/quercetin dioxygenase-like cupin family protein